MTLTLPRFFGLSPRKLKVVASEATGVPGAGNTDTGFGFAAVADVVEQPIWEIATKANSTQAKRFPG